jgi:hypothetical protein
LNTRASCASIVAETATIDANAKRQISVCFPPLASRLSPFRLPPYLARSLTADANVRTFAASLEPLASAFNSPTNVASALWRSLAERPSAEFSWRRTDEILPAGRPPERSS